MERVRHRPGPKSRVSAEVQRRMAELIAAHSELTIAEVRERIAASTGVEMSWSLVRLWMGGRGCGGKRSLYAQERDTEENRRRRVEFLETIRAVPPEKPPGEWPEWLRAVISLPANRHYYITVLRFASKGFVGSAACANSMVLRTKLRQDWRFEAYIVSY